MDLTGIRILVVRNAGLAVYEVEHSSHRTAPQFFVSIDEKGIRYGLVYGDQHPNRGQSDLTIHSNVETFTYR